MNRILITGAAGHIGRTLREGLRGRYGVLRLSDVVPMGEAGKGEELAPADLSDLAAVEAAMKGVDCVVHLGAGGRGSEPGGGGVRVERDIRRGGAGRGA